MLEKETDIFKLRLDVGYVQPGQRGHITNKRRLFVDVLDELKKPQKINAVTLGQYLQRSQDDQNRIKDIGALVFGHFADGKRRNENLRSRTAIALDVDELTQPPAVRSSRRAAICRRCPSTTCRPSSAACVNGKRWRLAPSNS